MDGFNRLQKEVLDRLNEYSDDDIKKTACHAEKLEDEKYREITVLLARIEHFAVGANTRIYNVRIIKRCAGKYFINLYKKLDPMIEQKKNKRPKAKHYDEFGTLTKKLTRMHKREELAEKIKNYINLKNKLTMPLGLYGFLAILGVALLISLKFLPDSEVGEDIAIGIACSIIAGVIVAIFNDWTATKIKHTTDGEKYKLQIKELESECGDLPCTVCVTVCDCCGDKIPELKSFDEWCGELFGLEQKSGDVTEKQEIRYCLETIKNIRVMSKRMKELAMNNLDNEHYDGEFIDKLGKLIHICDRIIWENASNKNENCKRIILNEFRKNVISIFPDLENEYTRKYNAETYEREAAAIQEDKS